MYDVFDQTTLEDNALSTSNTRPSGSDKGRSLVHFVWILGRLFSAAPSPPLVESSTAQKFPLCDWAVLVTDLGIVDLRVISERSWTRVGGGGLSAIELGTLYEVQRTGGGGLSLHICQPFCTSHLREKWTTFPLEFMSTTIMSAGEIYAEGSPSIFSKLTL